jgi:RNA polymerase sigma factor (sigma-70 family)
LSAKAELNHAYAAYKADPSATNMDTLLRAVRHFAHLSLHGIEWGSDRASHEDTCQEVVLRVWKYLPSFDGDSEMSTWVTRVVINQIRSEHRRTRTQPQPQPMDADPDTVLPLISVEPHQNKVGNLPPTINERERRVVEILLRTGSYSSVRQEMGLTELALKAVIHRIRKKVS